MMKKPESKKSQDTCPFKSLSVQTGLDGQSTSYKWEKSIGIIQFRCDFFNSACTSMKYKEESQWENPPFSKNKYNGL